MIRLLIIEEGERRHPSMTIVLNKIDQLRCKERELFPHPIHLSQTTNLSFEGKKRVRRSKNKLQKTIVKHGEKTLKQEMSCATKSKLPLKIYEHRLFY